MIEKTAFSRASLRSPFESNGNSSELQTQSGVEQMQAQVGFKVWGKIAGDAFEKVFPTVAAWKAWRRLNESRYEIEVLGMKSEAA